MDFYNRKTWEGACVILDRNDLTKLPVWLKNNETEIVCSIQIAARSLPWYYGAPSQWWGWFWSFI